MLDLVVQITSINTRNEIKASTFYWLVNRSLLRVLLRQWTWLETTQRRHSLRAVDFSVSDGADKRHNLAVVKKQTHERNSSFLFLSTHLPQDVSRGRRHRLKRRESKHDAHGLSSVTWRKQRKQRLQDTQTEHKSYAHIPLRWRIAAVGLWGVCNVRRGKRGPQCKQCSGAESRALLPSLTSLRSPWAADSTWGSQGVGRFIFWGSNTKHIQQHL